MNSILLVALVGGMQAPITIDLAKRTPISPYIYGANFPEWEKLKTPFPLVRQGGNRMTAYNWETNASNAGSDYRHQNDGYMGESNVAGWTVKSFIDSAQAHGAAALITVPTAGYVSADKGPEGDVNQTPNYLQRRFHKAHAKKPGGKYVYPPNTQDRAVYMDEMVAYLQRFAKEDRPIWYSLDNEPDLWAHTHERIVPKPLTYAGIIANNIEFATAIKLVAPKAKVFGPANYGWQGFRTFQGASDAKGRDFLDVYLAAMRQAETRGGRRLLDVLDIHWYPEARGDGVRIVMGDEKPGTAMARIQAPRSLWDPTYVEDSWIAESIGKKPIVLLPGLLKQIERHYPGTKLAITEYDFGGGTHWSGTLAQADVLGAYGRYGVWAACHWGISDDRPATLAGMRAFLAFDGKAAAFGNMALGVKGVRAEDEAVYAALDRGKPNRLTVVAINKEDHAVSRQIDAPSFRAGRVRAFVADPQQPLTPKPGSVRLQGNGFVAELPARSVVTIEATR